MQRQTGFDHLQRAIERLTPVPEGEWDFFARALTERAYEKGACLVHAGDVADSMFFVNKGLLRFFYSTPQGKQFNKHFVVEGGFAGSIHSLVLEEPCPFTIQALEDTAVIVLPHSLQRACYDRHPCWERLGRRTAEMLALLKENREKELLLYPLEVRYLRFTAEYPGLTERIPLYHVASYLGVTNVALSRLRRRIAAPEINPG